MLAVIQNASTPILGETKLPGKYAYSFWALNKRIILCSNKPFSRNDIVKVERTKRDNIFYVDPTTTSEVSKADLLSIGFLVPLATDIPFSSDVKYEFNVLKGDAKILSTLRNCVRDQTYYLLLLLCKSNMCDIIGYDSVYKDTVEFKIDLRSQFKGFIESVKESL